MDNSDYEEIKKLCEEIIGNGRKYKEMGESEIYKEMFGIQNSKEFAIGIILGTYLENIHQAWRKKYGHEMNQDDANLVLGIFNEVAPSIMDSLFK